MIRFFLKPRQNFELRITKESPRRELGFLGETRFLSQDSKDSHFHFCWTLKEGSWNFYQDLCASTSPSQWKRTSHRWIGSGRRRDGDGAKHDTEGRRWREKTSGGHTARQLGVTRGVTTNKEPTNRDRWSRRCTHMTRTKKSIEKANQHSI